MAPPSIEAVKKMKVAELKASLKTFGLPTNGLKAVLCARLLDHIQSIKPETSVETTMNDASGLDTNPNLTQPDANIKMEDVKMVDAPVEDVPAPAAPAVPVSKKEEEGGDDVVDVKVDMSAVKRERPASPLQPSATTTTTTTTTSSKKPKVEAAPSSAPAPSSHVSCPYLDTISRPNLDFDQIQSCSVTLTRSSVYCCLVCGSYFSGRGPGTPAHTHSVEADHNVFVSLTTPTGAAAYPPRYYSLPENYEVKNEPSLHDITEVRVGFTYI